MVRYSQGVIIARKARACVVCRSPVGWCNALLWVFRKRLCCLQCAAVGVLACFRLCVVYSALCNRLNIVSFYASLIYHSQLHVSVHRDIDIEERKQSCAREKSYENIVNYYSINPFLKFAVRLHSHHRHTHLWWMYQVLCFQVMCCSWRKLKRCFSRLCLLALLVVFEMANEWNNFFIEAFNCCWLRVVLAFST